MEVAADEADVVTSPHMSLPRDVDGVFPRDGAELVPEVTGVLPLLEEEVGLPWLLLLTPNCWRMVLMSLSVAGFAWIVVLPRRQLLRAF